MTLPKPRTRRTAQLVARAGVVGASVMLAVTAAGMLPGGPQAGAAEDAGFATIADPDTKAALQQGTGETMFTLKLPDGAACTGDNNAGYLVTSFMVPSSVDVNQLQFSPVTGPVPQTEGANFRQPLFELPAGEPYVSKPPANADTPGGPGAITGVGTFDLGSIFTPAQLPEGTYTLGIACVNGPPSATQLDRFWTAKLELATNASALTWTAIAQTGGGATTTSTTKAGGSTTTTKAGGSTTTTKAGGSTTTTTAIGGSTTTTAAGGATTTTRAAGTSTGGPSSSGGGALAATGTSPWGLAFWAAVLLLCGRLAIVLGRPPKVPTRG